MKTALNASLKSDTLNHYNKFKIPFVEISYVRQKLDSLDITKATRLDGISAKFLKTASDIICKPLFCNKSKYRTWKIPNPA
jgi:hypothetical protein